MTTKISENKIPKSYKYRLSFRILGVIDLLSRLDELAEIPKTPEGYTDYWLASKMLCEKDGGRLPTMKELAELASYLYDYKGFYPYNESSVIEYNKARGKKLGLPEPNFCLWSGEESNSNYAWARYFCATNSYSDNDDRGISSRQVVCLGD